MNLVSLLALLMISGIFTVVVLRVMTLKGLQESGVTIRLESAQIVCRAGLLMRLSNRIRAASFDCVIRLVIVVDRLLAFMTCRWVCGHCVSMVGTVLMVAKIFPLYLT